jgi:hypothetical protein
VLTNQSQYGIIHTSKQTKQMEDTTMNAVQNFASHSFSTYALANILPDEDANGLFCQVPSSDGKWYQVRCVEGKSSVHASHCNCSSFARHQHCTHIETTQKYWARFYKPVAFVEAPVVVEAPVKKTRKPRNGLVRKVRGGGLVRVAQPAPVAKIIEQAVEAVVPTPKKDMMSAALTTNKGFQLLR